MPDVSEIPALISSARALSSVTSQFAYTNRPFKNNASLLANQTMESAGRLTSTQSS